MRRLIPFLTCALIGASASAQTTPPISSPGQSLAGQPREVVRCAALYDPKMRSITPKCLTLEEVQAFRDGKLRGSFVTSPIFDGEGNLIRVDMIFSPKKP